MHRASVAAARRLLAAAACLFLAACASLPRSGQAPVGVAPTGRDAAWQLRGRVAVRSESGGGSGSVVWTRQPGRVRFELRAPVTGQGWTLAVEHGVATLSGLEGGPRQGRDAVALVREAVGWELPLASLGWWVRGQRAPGAGELERDADGLPLRLRQSGWTIEYKRWIQTADGLLPGKLFARRGSAELRLLVADWHALP